MNIASIQVALDTRLEVHPILKMATELARATGARLTLVDVVPDFPWMVRRHLKEHGHLHDLLVGEKREKLVELTGQLESNGISADSRVLSGRTSTALIHDALEHDYDLVMRVAKGANSRREGFFGTTSMELLRKCPRPVWLVTPEKMPPCEHIMACVDTTSDAEEDAELNARSCEWAVEFQRIWQGRLTVAHAWSIWNEPMLKSRMPETEFEALVRTNADHEAKLLDEFVSNRELGPADVQLVRGDPRDAIPNYAVRNDVDLIVMGTVARSGIAGFLVGNTAETILSQTRCSVLALKPGSFQCPVKKTP